jgi:hypothetical protein
MSQPSWKAWYKLARWRRLRLEIFFAGTVLIVFAAGSQHDWPRATGSTARSRVG